MSNADRSEARVSLSDQEKGIIFGVLLGTFLGLAIDALKQPVSSPEGVVARVTKGRQPANRY